MLAPRHNNSISFWWWWSGIYIDYYAGRWVNHGNMPSPRRTEAWTKIGMHSIWFDTVYWRNLFLILAWILLCKCINLQISAIPHKIAEIAFSHVVWSPVWLPEGTCRPNMRKTTLLKWESHDPGQVLAANRTQETLEVGLGLFFGFGIPKTMGFNIEWFDFGWFGGRPNLRKTSFFFWKPLNLQKQSCKHRYFFYWNKIHPCAKTSVSRSTEYVSICFQCHFLMVIGCFSFFCRFPTDLPMPNTKRRNLSRRAQWTKSWRTFP